jgi:dGTPase
MSSTTWSSHTHAEAEAQVAALADDIAYNNHDLEDGIRAGLFRLEEVAELALPGGALAQARAAHPDMPAGRAAPEMVRRVISAMVNDVAAETARRIGELKPESAQDIRLAPAPVVAFSAEMAQANKEVRDFLMERMYRHFRVNRATQKSKRALQVLFQLLHGGPQMLPDEWRARAGEAGTAQAAETVCDYIAGMTDRFALEEYRRLTDPHVGG